MPNRNKQPRLTCPCCKRPIRAKQVRIDNGDGTETSTLRFVRHVIGYQAERMKKGKRDDVCEGSGTVVTSKGKL